MRDDNFTKENNAKHMWHPMGHPADSLANPPKVIVSAQTSSITDIDGHTVVDAVGGLWCVNLGYSNDAVKEAISKQLYDLPYYSAFSGTSNPPQSKDSPSGLLGFLSDGILLIGKTTWRPRLSFIKCLGLFVPLLVNSTFV